jgi:hypothetical protein
MEELKKFENEDVVFYAIKNCTDENEFFIEQGEDFIYDEPEQISDEELEEWAEENEYLDDNSGFVLEDGTIDYKALGEFKREEDISLYEEYPPSYATPSGRAFLWFDNLEIEIPKEIKIEIIDGPSPGNDWQGVIVNGYESLLGLQTFLFENNIKINFKLKS